MAEFSSVVDGVRCAVEIQKGLGKRNAELLEHRRMEFRAYFAKTLPYKNHDETERVVDALRKAGLK